MREEQRLLMVVGLAHSGTTIMDLALGVSPLVQGVGEALRMCDPAAEVSAMRQLSAGLAENVVCSCGRSAASCPLWCGFTPKLGPSLEASFEQVLTAARAHMPNAIMVLDSSPNGWTYLPQLVDKYNIQVLHLTRDVRSWTYSRRRGRAKGLIDSYWVWSLGNRAIEQALRAHPVQVLNVGYEEFALQPEPVLRRICDWLGISYLEAMLAPHGNTNSHIMVGNRAAKNPSLVSLIRYDGSWLAERPALGVQDVLNSMVSRQNHRLVYSNQVLKRHT